MKKIIVAIILVLFGAYFLSGNKIGKQRTLVEQLAGMSATERADFKAQELVRLNPIGQYERNGYQIEILSVTKRPINNVLQVVVKASKDGNKIGFSRAGTVELERFNIYNPPILVDDPNGTIGQVIGDEKTGTHIRKLKEDPVEALKQVVAETILEVGHNVPGRVIDGREGSTFSIFYAAAGVGAGSVDCRIEIIDGGGQAWSTIVTGAGTSVSNTSTNGGLYSEDNGTAWVENMRTFEDEAIAATIGTDTIVAATSSVTDADTFNDNTTHNFARVLAVGGAIQDAEQDECIASDYEDQNQTALASDTVIDLGSRTANVRIYLPHNAAGLAELASAVSGSRPARFVHEFDKDQSNTAPTLATAASYWYHIHADTAGTASDPKITIEHTAAAATPVSASARVIILEADE